MYRVVVEVEYLPQKFFISTISPEILNYGEANEYLENIRLKIPSAALVRDSNYDLNLIHDVE